MKIRKRTLLAATLLLTLAQASYARACPGCKEALASQTGEASKLKDGYYHSILIMMAMPFALLGTGTFFVVRAVKRGTLPEM